MSRVLSGQLSTETRQKNIWYVLVIPACDPSHKMGSVTESIGKRALCILKIQVICMVAMVNMVL